MDTVDAPNPVVQAGLRRGWRGGLELRLCLVHPDRGLKAEAWLSPRTVALPEMHRPVRVWEPEEGGSASARPKGLLGAQGFRAGPPSLTVATGRLPEGSSWGGRVGPECLLRVEVCLLGSHGLLPHVCERV